MFHRPHTLRATLVALLLAVAGASQAGVREDLLAQYATTAKTDNAAFSGWSAARGKELHTQKFTSGKADTPSCTTCHSTDPRASGRAPSGKTIDAMAVSATPSRYTDAAKVEKWFRRNCMDVLARECTAGEKADVLAYLSSLK